MDGYLFDADTRLGPAEDGAVPVTVTDRWSGPGSVNGGFMLALCTMAIARVLPFPDPIVVSGFFLRPGTPGPAVIRPSVARAGRSTAFGEASLWREGREVMRATAAFATLGGGSGEHPEFVGITPPDLPPPGECVGMAPGALPGISIADQLEYRAAGLPGWLRGEPTGEPSAEFWMRFRDGRPPDLNALSMLVDAAAPVVLEIGATSTTIQLTVHLRAHPAPGWLACRTTTNHVSGGYHEEDFEIWDSAGTLVAQSRQLGLLLPP
jgi:acyl-coenzyme A thioesterase PaaI-like protein